MKRKPEQKENDGLSPPNSAQKYLQKRGKTAAPLSPRPQSRDTSKPNTPKSDEKPFKKRTRSTLTPLQPTLSQLLATLKEMVNNPATATNSPSPKEIARFKQQLEQLETIMPDSFRQEPASSSVLDSDNSPVREVIWHDEKQLKKQKRVLAKSLNGGISPPETPPTPSSVASPSSEAKLAADEEEIQSPENHNQSQLNRNKQPVKRSLEGEFFQSSQNYSPDFFVPKPPSDQTIQAQINSILAEFNQLNASELTELDDCLDNLENSTMHTINRMIDLGETTLAKLNAQKKQLMTLMGNSQDTYHEVIAQSIKLIEKNLHLTRRHLFTCEREKTLYQEHLTEFNRYFKIKDTSENATILQLNYLLQPQADLNSDDHPNQLRAMLRMAFNYIDALNTATSMTQADERQRELVNSLSEMHRGFQPPACINPVK